MGVGGSDVSPFIFLRILYTSTFFIFIDTILVNIIFGVIIDTFSDLREQNERMEEEMEQRYANHSRLCQGTMCLNHIYCPASHVC